MECKSLQGDCMGEESEDECTSASLWVISKSFLRILVHVRLVRHNLDHIKKIVKFVASVQDIFMQILISLCVEFDRVDGHVNSRLMRNIPHATFSFDLLL